MNQVKIVFKKVGNHWYPDINHFEPNDIRLDGKAEKFLSYLDKWKDNIVEIYVNEQIGLTDKKGLIQFNDNDLLRYFTTNDSFTMSLYISDHQFFISSKLYSLIEENFKLDLHELIYKIDIYNEI